jgi:hypothetical protein
MPKKVKILLASKSGSHFEQIHEKKPEYKILHYCPIKLCTCEVRKLCPWNFPPLENLHLPIKNPFFSCV